MLLKIRDPNYHKAGPSASEPERVIDLLSEPCPCVMATGIRGASINDHYLVERERRP